MAAKDTTPKTNSLPVPDDVRAIVEEAMTIGEHGTLTNTIRVAMRNHLRVLKGEMVLVPAGQAAGSTH